MPTTTLMPLPKQQFISLLGTPLAGGKVFTYAAGTSTPKETFTDPAGTVPQQNPITLNLRGEPDSPIYWSGNYRVEVRSGGALSRLIYTVDNFNTDPMGLIDQIANLFKGDGSNFLGYISNAVGAIKTTVQEVLRREVSIVDFMSDEQRLAWKSGQTAEITDALAKAQTYLQPGRRTVTIPAGSYSFAQTFDVPANSCVRIDSKADLNFTSTASPAIRIRRGVTFHGKLAKLTMTNPAWDGYGMLLDGEDKFLDSFPTFVSGLQMDSVTFGKGTGLHLQALNAGHYISFVRFRDFSFGENLNYALTLACGNSGDVNNFATWHWINSNFFEDFVSFSKHGISVTGTSGAPAEVTANQILNFHFQSGSRTELPIYFFGASNNTLTGWVWDWDNNAKGSPIVFDGAAKWNNFYTNVDASVVTTAQMNKVHDMTGGETGQKIFFGDVVHFAQAFFGKSGVAGKYSATFRPETVGGNTFHLQNDGSALSMRNGPDPATAQRILNLTAQGTAVVGDNYENATVSTFRTNGAANRSARAARVGTDGFGADIFENAAGTQVGSVTVNTSGTTYNTSSDYRLKSNVTTLSNAATFIDRLRPVSWKWKVDGSAGYGFIAHELQEVSPSSVTGAKDAVDAKTGAPIYQAVEYGSAEVIANLVASVQELQKFRTTAEAKLKTL